MLRTARTVITIAAALALVPAATASAATATFTGTFEAERTVNWDQPRYVSQKTCRGEHYVESSGNESWKVKTRKPVKVSVFGSGKRASWTFGDVLRDPGASGIEAGGVRTREWRHRTGRTGGWCGGEETDPPLKNDCGTLLPTYLVRLSGGNGKVDWTLSTAPEMRRERTDFYSCALTVPRGLYTHSFSSLPATVKGSEIFNRRKKTIEIGASKTFGPDSTPLGNGTSRTAGGTMSWKLTLKRTR